MASKNQKDIELTKPLKDKSTQNGGEKKPEKNPDDPPDGGWGWVVCFASMWCNGTCFGIINTFGVLLKEMIKEYSTPENESEISSRTALVGSLAVGLIFFLSPVSSILVDRLGIRKTAFTGSLVAFLGLLCSSFIPKLEYLYLTFGVMLGAGSSFAYAPSLIILGHYFKDYLGWANGIVTLGSAIFTIALPYTISGLLDSVGLQNTLRCLSGMYFILTLLTLTWKPRIAMKHTELDHLLSTESLVVAVKGCKEWLSKFLYFKIWHNKAYVIWVISVGTCLFGYFIPFMQLLRYIEEIQLPGSEGKSEMVVQLIGGISGISRLLSGKLSDLPQVNRVRLQQTAFMLMGIFTTIIPLMPNFWSLAIVCVILGLCDGVFVCLLGPIAFDIIGPRGASQAVGFLLGIMAIPLCVGPPVAGLMRDKLGSYELAFYVAGTPPLIGGLIMFFIPKIKQHFPHVTIAEEERIMADDNLDEPEPDVVNLFHSGVWTKDAIRSGCDLSDKPKKKAAKGPKPNADGTVYVNGFGNVKLGGSKRNINDETTVDLIDKDAGVKA